MHLSRDAYLRLGTQAARTTARRNGAADVAVSFPGAGLAPVRVRVTVGDPLVALGATLRRPVAAEAELLPPGSLAGGAGAGDYRGPLAVRQGAGCARTWRWPSTASPPRRAPTASR